MTHDTLANLWFIILGVLLVGYAILDGFDLGVGILHPFVAKTDHERRIVMNSIGPLWDGNEVWLVTFGGAMFAMFPYAYASIFSGFFTAFMLLLFALILRAVSLEFRSKMHGERWRRVWDYGFCLASGLATFLFGVAVGAAIKGLPINEAGDFTGTILDQITPYSILVGLLAVAMFTLHGTIYLYLKTEGELQARLKPVMWRAFGFFMVVYFLVTMFTLATIPHALENLREHEWFWLVPVANVLAIANIPRAIYQGREAYAFVSSSATILALVLLFSLALYPNLVVSSSDPAHSVSIFTASSSAKTLTIGLIIVAVGMPFVLAYTAVVYWSFHGKVKLTETSY